MSSEHPLDERIHLLVDGRLGEAEAAAIRNHMRTCTRCSSTHASLTRLDRTLRSLPDEHLASDVTSTIMAKLRIASGPPLLFRAVENLAYAFGLMIVLGMMFTAFVLTGAVDTGQIAESERVFNAAAESATDQLQSLLASFTSAMQSYMPFAFGHGSMKIAVMATIVVAMLALVDRIMKRRMLR